MSENRIEGAVKKATGVVKEATGKAVHNTRLEGQGGAEKAVGTVQNKVVKAQDQIASEHQSHS